MKSMLKPRRRINQTRADAAWTRTVGLKMTVESSQRLDSLSGRLSILVEKQHATASQVLRKLQPHIASGCQPYVGFVNNKAYSISLRNLTQMIASAWWRAVVHYDSLSI